MYSMYVYVFRLRKDWESAVTVDGASYLLLLISLLFYPPPHGFAFTSLAFRTHWVKYAASRVCVIIDSCSVACEVGVCHVVLSLTSEPIPLVGAQRVACVSVLFTIAVKSV